MAEALTKAIFVREFHWSRPKSPLGFGARPGPDPQQFPRDFIEAALACGAAKPVTVPRRKQQPAAPAADLKE